MFDRERPFYWINRCLEFTMPPICKALGSRWDDEADDSTMGSFFLLQESYDEESCKGFQVPCDVVDPLIESGTGVSFLEWANFQVAWGGFGLLEGAYHETLPLEVYEGMDLAALRRIFFGEALLVPRPVR